MTSTGLLRAGRADPVEGSDHYAKSPARTDFHEFPGRSHWTCAEPGREAVADHALDWAEKYGR